MKTIAQQLNIKKYPFTVTDSDGNQIYYETFDGYWEKSEFDSKGNRIYYENSNKFWRKAKFDAKGNIIYYEDSYWENKELELKKKIMKRHLELVRLSDDGTQTLGELYVVEDNKIIYTTKSLELPYRDNKRKVSCIPSGEYRVTKRRSKYSFKYEHLLINDVPNRDYILIHGGNYNTDILGCILVGNRFKDINGDGLDDVLNSLNTLKELLTYIPDEGIDLKIYYR